MSPRPLCFVLMPFGRKTGTDGQEIDFDQVYEKLIAPAVEAADLDVIRADEELVGGIIHKPMFERLMLCDYAVADLTLANANVYYELGIRHAVRPYSTVLIFAEGQRLPFDLGPVRGFPYRLKGRVPAQAKKDGAKLTGLLRSAREAHTDSPVFQLVEDFRGPELDHLKTEVFRDRVEYSRKLKARLRKARKQGETQVAEVEDDLGNLEDAESGVLVDLLLSYRDVEAWERMIELFAKLPEPLRRTILVREQYAFALNRAKRGGDAEQVLRDVLEDHGPSSETYGLLGRVYKDRWDRARKAGEDARARGLLKQAADTYRKGFETDWRDAYPGINAATLMELQDPPDPQREEILPVVVYSAQRRVDGGEPDYWDWATLLEARVLWNDEQGAWEALEQTLARLPKRKRWMAKSTAGNLRMIREARDARGEAVDWLRDIENALVPAE